MPFSECNDTKVSTLIVMNEIDQDKSKNTIDFEDYFNVVTFQMGDSDSEKTVGSFPFLGSDAGQRNPKISFNT
jgi:hypothetical protein